MFQQNYQRPVRSSLGRCYVGTPNIKNPLTGGNLYTSDNTNFKACQTLARPGGAGPFINKTMTFNNQFLEGDAGLCCNDFNDLVGTGPALANSSIIQAAVCGNYDNLPGGSLIPENIRDTLTGAVQKLIPANYGPITDPTGTARYIPMRSLICDGRLISDAAAKMPPPVKPTDLPTTPIDADW